MKARTIIMTLCVPFIIGAAHAQSEPETLYYYVKDSISSYSSFNDPYNYADSSGARPDIEPDWNNLYNIVVDMNNIYNSKNTNHVGYLTDRWKINSLTFVDATGSLSAEQYWWDQTNGGTGMTLDIVNDLNFYNPVACGNAKKFNMNVGGSVNIDIKTDIGGTGYNQVNFTGLLALDVKNDFIVSQFGNTLKGKVYFGPYYTENGVTHKGTISIGRNLDVTGVDSFEFIKCSSLTIGGNVSFKSSNNSTLAESDYVHIVGNLSANTVNNLYMHNNAYMQIDGAVDLSKTEFRAYGQQHTVKIGKDLTSHDSGAHIYMDRTAYLEVLGSLTAEGAFENRDAGYTYIKGDFNIGAAGNAKLGNFLGKDGNSPQSASNAGFEVGGKINMNGGKITTFFTNGTPPSDTKKLFVSTAGISGSGTLELSNAKSPEEEYSVTYVLNNIENSSFSGGITYGTSAVEFGKMRLNIIKKGAGTQTFIINNADSVWAGTVTMEEGVLNLYADSSSNVKIDLALENGGGLAVSYAKEGKHDPSADYMGVIYANSLAINGDSKIIFDAVNTPGIGYESDMIIAGDVSGEGIATLAVDLDTETFDSGEIITDMTLEIFRVENNNYDWAKAVLKVMYGSDDITGKFSKLVTRVEGNSVYIDLAGVVPEPAEAAAILGAIAIALAAYRRRKR